MCFFKVWKKPRLWGMEWYLEKHLFFMFVSINIYKIWVWEPWIYFLILMPCFYLLAKLPVNPTILTHMALLTRLVHVMLNKRITTRNVPMLSGCVCLPVSPPPVFLSVCLCHLSVICLYVSLCPVTLGCMPGSRIVGSKMYIFTSLQVILHEQTTHFSLKGWIINI